MVEAKLDDGIISDAAAGADYVKIRRGILFSEKEVDLLEVHEGWVHVGTSINGSKQRVANWLAKGPPCTTAIQEGLAVLMEVLTFTANPLRSKKLNNRILACDKVEDGANFLDIIEFYRTEGYPEKECLTAATRVFRGSLPTGGGPFTKDITYCKGFVMCYNFLRTAIRFGRPDLIPFLFCGKVTLDDVAILHAEMARRRHRQAQVPGARNTATSTAWPCGWPIRTSSIGSTCRRSRSTTAQQMCP